MISSSVHKPVSRSISEYAAIGNHAGYDPVRTIYSRATCFRPTSYDIAEVFGAVYWRLFLNLQYRRNLSTATGSLDDVEATQLTCFGCVFTKKRLRYAKDVFQPDEETPFRAVLAVINTDDTRSVFMYGTMKATIDRIKSNRVRVVVHPYEDAPADHTPMFKRQVNILLLCFHLL
jgi:hypothetical protein